MVIVKLFLQPSSQKLMVESHEIVQVSSGVSSIQTILAIALIIVKVVLSDRAGLCLSDNGRFSYVVRQSNRVYGYERSSKCLFSISTAVCSINLSTSVRMSTFLCPTYNVL